MGKIKLNNIRVYAQHGCLKEESVIGSDYRVDLKVKTDLSRPSSTDNLSDTVDYVHLNAIVKEEIIIDNILFWKPKLVWYICTLYGIVAEWLGTALQKLVQRFESARCLQKTQLICWVFYFLAPFITLDYPLVKTQK